MADVSAIADLIAHLRAQTMARPSKRWRRAAALKTARTRRRMVQARSRETSRGTGSGSRQPDEHQNGPML
jgi:hypothetical protein